MSRSMFNEMLVMGRMAYTPKVNESKGRKYVSVYISNERNFNDGNSEQNKIPINLSGELAERFLSTVKQGDVIVVEGYFQSSDYTRGDGGQSTSYRLHAFDFYRVDWTESFNQAPQQSIQPEFQQSMMQGQAMEQTQAPLPPAPEPMRPDQTYNPNPYQ